jgi:hypothetical protein
VPARGGRHGRRRRATDRNVPDQRGPARPRRQAADGRGGREGPHPSSSRPALRTSCTWSWRLSSWATPGRSGSSAMEAFRGTQTAVRSWRRCNSSATSYSCATRSRTVSTGTEAKHDASAHGDDPYPGHAAAAVRYGFGATARVYTLEGLAGGRRASRPRPGRRRRCLRIRKSPELVWIHSEYFTGDVHGSEPYDCAPQVGGPALPAPGGPRDRSVCEARRLRPSGRRPRHVRRQPRTRLQRGRSQRRCWVTSGWTG